MKPHLVFALLFLGTFLKPYAQLPTTGLLAHYTLDSHANDKSIFKNNGTINGGVEPAEDRFGNKNGALHFNGLDGFISVANSAELRAPKTSISISCWVKLEKLNPSSNDIHLALLSKSAESTSAQYQFYLRRFFGDLKSSIFLSSEINLQDNNYTNHPFEFGQWYFVALVFEDIWVQLYVNGKLVCVNMSNKVFAQSNAGIEIGRDNIGGTKYFCGSMDDLRIYNRGLNVQEITALYNDVSGKNVVTVLPTPISTTPSEPTITTPTPTPVTVTKKDSAPVIAVTKPATTIVAKTPTTSITTSNQATSAIIPAPDIEKNNEEGKCYAVVNYSEPTIILPNQNKALLKLSAGNSSGSNFFVGKRTITYETVSEKIKQTSSFNITVIDNEPPQLTCTNDMMLYADESLHRAKVDYVVMANDNCPNMKLEMIAGFKSGYLFPVGVTPIKYRATDASGNMKECGFKIVVIEKATTEKSEQKKINPIAENKAAVVEEVVAVQQTKTNEEQKNIPIAKSNHVVKEEEAPIPPMGKMTPIKGDDLKLMKSEPELKRDAATKVFEVQKAETKNEEVIPSTTVEKKEVEETSSTLPTITRRNNIPVATSPPKPWHFNCRTDTVIHLPMNRKGIVYHYSNPSVSTPSFIDNMEQTLGSHDGCFLQVGVHPFSFTATDVWGKTQTCAYSVFVKDDLAAAVTVVPQKIEPQLHIGNDAVNYEHHAEVNDCFLTVFIYDDGEEDNDSVSIIFNGQIIVNREMIRVKEHGAIIRQLVLLHGNENYIIAKAWNTGKFGLNTLKIDVYEGDVEQGKKGIVAKKPVLTKVLHSKPGNAGGMILTCK